MVILNEYSGFGTSRACVPWIYHVGHSTWGVLLVPVLTTNISRDTMITRDWLLMSDYIYGPGTL